MAPRKRTTALLGFGLLMSFGAPAWCGEPATPATNVEAASANPDANSLMSMLNSVVNGSTTDRRKPDNHCKASQLYSQHDVVGDPEACIMGTYTLGTGSNGSAAGIP